MWGFVCPNQMYWVLGWATVRFLLIVTDRRFHWPANVFVTLLRAGYEADAGAQTSRQNQQMPGRAQRPHCVFPPGRRWECQQAGEGRHSWAHSASSTQTTSPACSWPNARGSVCGQIPSGFHPLRCGGVALFCRCSFIVHQPTQHRPYGQDEAASTPGVLHSSDWRHVNQRRTTVPGLQPPRHTTLQ